MFPPYLLVREATRLAFEVLAAARSLRCMTFFLAFERVLGLHGPDVKRRPRGDFLIPPIDVRKSRDAKEQQRNRET
jgi:hypothetical protein